MKVSTSEIDEMYVIDFNKKLKIMEALLAEERFILQRQLDNHLKINSKNTINKYMDIYKEFEVQMKKITKARKLTTEEMKALHEKNLRTLGL